MPQSFTRFMRCLSVTRGLSVTHCWSLRWAARLMTVALLMTVMLPSGMIAQAGCVEHACAGHACPDVPADHDLDLDHADGQPCGDCPCAGQPADLPPPIRVLPVTNAITYLPRPAALPAPPAPILDTDLPPIIRG